MDTPAAQHACHELCQPHQLILPRSFPAPAQPKRYSRKLPDQMRSRLVRRPLWDGLRSRLLPELQAVCSAAMAASEAELPNKDAVMEALALGGPAGAPVMCGNPSCATLRCATEARLLRTACPGCGVAHYCCGPCMRADAARHTPACAALRRMGMAHSGHSTHSGDSGDSKPAGVEVEDSAGSVGEAADQLASLRLGG